MFEYKTIKEQLFEEKKKREAAEAGLGRVFADVDYIAMMCGVELEAEEELFDEQI